MPIKKKKRVRSGPLEWPFNLLCIFAVYFSIPSFSLFYIYIYWPLYNLHICIHSHKTKFPNGANILIKYTACMRIYISATIIIQMCIYVVFSQTHKREADARARQIRLGAFNKIKYLKKYIFRTFGAYCFLNSFLCDKLGLAQCMHAPRRSHHLFHCVWPKIYIPIYVRSTAVVHICAHHTLYLCMQIYVYNNKIKKKKSSEG